MAYASYKKTVTRGRVKIKNSGKPNAKVKGLKSSNTRGNKNHCPVCGKFI